jgi:hypothetical protein
MLLDPSKLNGHCCSAAGIKIDFAGSLGQNGKCWRWAALGPGLPPEWTIWGPRGEAHNNRMHAELPSAVFLYPMPHLRQPGDAGPFVDRLATRIQCKMIRLNSQLVRSSSPPN